MVGSSVPEQGWEQASPMQRECRKLVADEGSGWVSWRILGRGRQIHPSGTVCCPAKRLAHLEGRSDPVFVLISCSGSQRRSDSGPWQDYHGY